VHRQERKDLSPFRHVAHSQAHHPIGRHALDFAPVEQHSPALRVHHAANGAQDGRFARAVGAKHGDDLAGRDIQADATDGTDRPVVRFDPIDAQQGRGPVHASPPI
jgi:hypothetical protein